VPSRSSFRYRGKVGDQIELFVESLAYGGKGIARIQNFVFFIQNGLPHQKVLAKIVKKRKDFSEAVVSDVLEESPFFIPKKCKHFSFCGGCSFQNLNYQVQLDQKHQQVLDLYLRIGEIQNIRLDKIVPADKLFHYRNKMEFTFSNRRWILPEEKDGVKSNFALGLHVPGRYDKILDIRTCWIQKPIGNKILRQVKSFTRQKGIIPYDILKHTGFLRYLIIRIGEYTGEVMVNLVTSRKEPELLQPLVDQLITEFPQITSIVNNITCRKAGVSYGEQEVLLHGVPYIHDKIDNFFFEISSNSFFQTNTLQAEKLYQAAVESAELSGKEVLYDLYCGTGSTSIFFSSHVRSVYGFELNSFAIEDAIRNALSNECYNCRFFEANLDNYFRITPTIRKIEKPDVVLLDPPRAGMHPKLVRDVIQMKPKKIVYISCNPSTQARDVALLYQGGYHLKQLVMVDMFPHTPHIETVVLLTK